MPIKRKAVAKWMYRPVKFGEVPSDVRGEWFTHGPSDSEIRVEFEPRVKDMMLRIAVALRARWQVILCNLAAELAPDDCSKLFFRVALRRHWEAGHIVVGVRYREDLPPASEVEEEPSGENGYVMTKYLVVSPVTAKPDEWLRGRDTDGSRGSTKRADRDGRREEPVDHTVDAISEALSGQLLKLYEFLQARKHWTRFDSLRKLACWRDEPDDETIYRALRRLRDALNEIDSAPHLMIAKRDGRTRLDKTGPK